MKYCIFCGQPLPDEARFCANCGTAVKTTGYSASSINENADVEIGISVLLNNNNNQESTEKEIYLEHNHKTLAVNIPNGISVGQRIRLRGMGKPTRSGKTGDLFIRIDHIAYKKSTEQQTARKVVYDGEIHKCPNCGEIINSFVSICPACGHELRETRSASAIRALAEKLERASSERQQITIIKNFPIPNTKEDIFEFMLLASSNFDASYYVTHLHEEDISDAWLAKIEQCYSKAKLSFGRNSDFEKIESIYLKIKADCADKESKIKHEEKTRRETYERAETEKGFKKSKLRVAIIIFTIISALCIAVSFNDDKILSGIIAIGMFVLLVIAFLMGSGVIKEKIKNIRLLPFILALILFVPYFAAYDRSALLYDKFDDKTYETIVWNELVLGNILPSSNSLEGRIITNSDVELEIYLANANKSTFSSYVQECQSKDFTIDPIQKTISYDAYNLDGYKLRLYFDESDSELFISVKDPIKRNKINWSAVPLMKDVPKPPSSTGEFGNNFDWTVTIYLVDVTREQYDNYIDKCIEEGFSVDMSRYENSFFGDNKDGYELQISWEGNNTICVHVTNLELL